MVIPTENPDVGLKLLSETDAGPLFGLVDQNRSHLRRWLPWVDASTSVAHTTEFIRGSLKRFQESAGFVYAVTYQDAMGSKAAKSLRAIAALQNVGGNVIREPWESVAGTWRFG